MHERTVCVCLCVCLYVCVCARVFVHICTFMPVVILCIYRVSNEATSSAKPLSFKNASARSVCGQDGAHSHAPVCVQVSVRVTCAFPMNDCLRVCDCVCVCVWVLVHPSRLTEADPA